eukprot:GHVN01013260.1.p2 GENE.GHVN01013260.1~~GHVN01013260.1.p2  ORF type:complete len:246 (+),score=26.02 GHVN01013260.1:2925-3662(+)
MAKGLPFPIGAYLCRVRRGDVHARDGGIYRPPGLVSKRARDRAVTSDIPHIPRFHGPDPNALLAWNLPTLPHILPETKLPLVRDGELPYESVVLRFKDLTNEKPDIRKDFTPHDWHFMKASFNFEIGGAENPLDVFNTAKDLELFGDVDIGDPHIINGRLQGDVYAISNMFRYLSTFVNANIASLRISKRRLGFPLYTTNALTLIKNTRSTDEQQLFVKKRVEEYRFWEKQKQSKMIQNLVEEAD